MSRLPLRAYWHRQIRNARDPGTRVTRAYEYLRAVAAKADPRDSRGPLLVLAETIAQAADDLKIAPEKEGTHERHRA